MKYEIGDFVSKPVIGTCKIENILYLNPQGKKVYCYGCQIFPDSRKSVIYGAGRCSWKAKAGNL